MSKVTSAKAVRIHESLARSNWRITFSDGRLYLANTYPGSQLVYIENASGRKVSGAKLRTEVCAAIAKATGDTQ